ncbi:unnamed protein product [Eruca vesicaria subsp. sativa]|uniref:Legume lectin domain-containing protein n=1 Tax=Eruca vesicaria subsp. sativa TaxID=29727 RepID=A0ABC8JST5_ERUVS|nr:unnamed protein product [Eruca vesicaria subsp. sativa]
MAFFKALAFLLLISLADADSSFSFNGFVKSPSFDKNIALFRDSKLVVVNGGGSSIQLTDSVSQSQGRVLYKKPITLFQEGNKGRNFSGSFSTSFSFSMMSSKELSSSVLLAFVMVPSGLDLSLFGRKGNTSSGLGFLLKKEIVAVEFGVSKRGRNRVGVLVGRPESARIRNVSSFGGHFNGKKLSCWIDYEASSKRIEVRLSLSNNALKPVDPFISYSVDLAKIWKEKKFMVGLISANGNSSKPHYLHSWSFKLRHPSMRIHSQPLDPNAVSKTVKEEEKKKTVEVKGKSQCVWRMLSALVLGAVCGILSAMFALYLWTIWGNRRSMAVVPEECADEKSDTVVDEEAKK